MADEQSPSSLLDETSDLRSSNVVEEFGAEILDFVHRADRDGIIFYAIDGDIEYANEMALELLDTPNLVGQNFFDIRDQDYATLGNRPDFGPLHDELVRRAIEGEATRGDFYLHTPDGTRDLEVLYGPVLGDGDKVRGIIATYRDVTEWRRLNTFMSKQNEEIEAQRAFFASILDVLDDGVVALTESLDIVLVNPACRELLGLETEAPEDLEEMLGNCKLLRPSAVRAQIERSLRQNRAGTGVHLVADGEEIRCFELGITFGGLDENLVICTFRDITEWQQVQQFQLLAEIGRLGATRTNVETMTEKMLEAIFEQLNVDIAILALFDRGRLRPVVWRGVMLEPEFLVDPLSHPDVEEALSTSSPVETDGTEWDRTSGAMTGTHYVVPLVASGKNLGTLHLGSLQSVRLFSTPNRAYADPAATFDRVDRSFLSALGSYIAVTIESTRLFDAAEEGNARMETLIKRMPDGVVLFNARGEIVFYNEAAEALAGMKWTNLNSDSRPYRIRDLEGRPLPRGDWPFFKAVRTGEAILNQEVIFDYGNRKRHVEVNAIPVARSDAQIPTFLGTLKDVTERSQQDRRKDEFLSVASHELRSPMTPLTGFIQMTRRKLEKGEMPDVSLVVRAEYQVERLSRLIDGLLDMTRIETGRMVLQRERLDLAELIFRTLDAWTSHPKEFRLEIDVPRDRPVIASVDPVRIDQVLTNIVDNAVKHVESGGKIAVQLVEEPGQAKIVVRDNGTGIPPSSLDNIFDRFYQADSGEHPTGVGLGLYITREIVLQHGGDIAIESDPGVETEVTILLPLEPH